MLFLKQIRAYGFKSFAEQTVLDFTESMVGVVGPNGSGKSNITDAIRWALGEQSLKSLRGKNIDEVVFSGSADKPALNVAEVTLVFNNETRILPTVDQDIVEITRRFDKKTHESIFFVNSERVQQRVVRDIALDTGLTRSSIAIISQGSIANFAEVKPEARREIFDEAAGLAKYKKRKQDSLKKLLRTMENYNRLNDIKNEINRRLPNLERQSKKAKKAQTMRQELEQFEVAILTLDVQKEQQRIDEILCGLPTIEEKAKVVDQELQISQSEFNGLLAQTTGGEQSVSQMNERFNEILRKINDLQKQKVQADLYESNASQNAQLDELKAQQIKDSYNQSKVHLETQLVQIGSWEKVLTDLRQNYDIFQNKYRLIAEKIGNVRRDVMRLEQERDTLRAKRNSFEARNGAQAVVKQKNILSGVIDTLLNLSSVEAEHQYAISVVSGSSFVNSVVMESKNDVKMAVEYLKKNQLGRATFLALDSLEPNLILGSAVDLIEQQPGFVGFANNLVKINSDYQIAINYVLGTIIVVKTYDDALHMGRIINHRYNIVSLDGDRILPRGAIVGGKTAQNQNVFANSINTHLTTIEEIENKLELKDQAELALNKELNESKQQMDNLRDEISVLQGKLNVGKDQIKQLEQTMKSNEEEYRILTNSSLIGDKNAIQESASLKLTKQIAKLELERDDLQMELNRITALKNKYAERQRELNEINMAKRSELDELKENISSFKNELTILQDHQFRNMQTLTSKYHLTLETVLANKSIEIFNDEPKVREQVNFLVNELQKMGNVNYDSIEEYQSEKERFDYYEEQAKEIYEAVQTLEQIIKDIDQEMSTQFEMIINNVNEVLPDVFKKMFGGGTAELFYTDPKDLLETGIDIKVNPPGKKIINLNLLSGGEKSLVALSVLFSILKVRPLPLIILDEVEAPLDSANVERFAQYVKNFTALSQFIIVTHREGTMENCDVLFGVTMEVQGVTKMVKIKLVEARKLATKQTENIINEL